MTRAEIRNLARKRLGETTAAFWTDAELNSWIDDAGDDLAFKTKSIKANGLMTTTEDQAEYILSTAYPNLLSVLEVYYYQNGTTWKKIKKTSRDELSITNPGWKSAESGTPIKFYWDKEEDLIGFWVKPDSSNDGAYARVYYSRTYTDLASDTAVPTLPEFLHKAQADYVVARGYESRGYGDKSNNAWAQYYRRISEYLVERRLEKQELEDDNVMKNYRNIG